MSIKRTLTFASAITLIAIVGVMYVSFESKQESSAHKASVAIVTNTEHAGACTEKCELNRCKMKSSICTMDCMR